MRVLPGTKHPCFGNPLEASQLQKGVNDSILHDVSTLEDGLGNKAKLQRTKNNSIKIEYTSSVVL